MPAPRLPRRARVRAITSALVLAACAALMAHPPARAQENAPHTARETVSLNAPARLPFSEAIAQRLRVPEGFAVNVFASGLGKPRMMEVGPDGTVYVTRRDEDDVLALRDADGDGRAESVTTFAANLDGVHGIALKDGEAWLASSTTIWRTPLAQAAPKILVDGLPDGGQHANRMLRFGPDGLLYVSVGSSCNDCAEGNPRERAAMLRYTPDGLQRVILATGLRNTIGYDWQPATGRLWGMDHGSDFHGDKKPPEELNRIVLGRHYGWPICFAKRVVDEMTNAPPERVPLRPGATEGEAMSREDFCARTEPSVLELPAHSAPMAMRFVADDGFAPGWRGDAILALRGSWNRSEPVGYSVVRLRFDARGEPAAVEPLLSGFLADDRRGVWGRPVGIAFARDGALLVSDDTNGAIYRIAWRGRR